MLLDRETNQSYDNAIIMTILFRKTFIKDEGRQERKSMVMAIIFLLQHFNTTANFIYKLETRVVNFLSLIVV